MIKTHPFFDKLALLAATNPTRIEDGAVIVRTRRGVYIRNQSGCEIFLMRKVPRHTFRWELCELDGNGRVVPGRLTCCRQQKGLRVLVSEME